MSKLAIIVISLLVAGLLLTSPTFAVFDTDSEAAAHSSFSHRWIEHNQRWSHLGVEAAWDIPGRRAPVVVAVLDSGVDLNHPALKDRLLPGRNFVAGQPAADVDDEAGHGTGVAGIIAAIADGGVDAKQKLPPLQIIPVKVCDKHQRCESLAALDGLNYAIEHGADVVNMSFMIHTDGFWRSIWAEALETAHRNGVVVVVSAGNQQEFLSTADDEHYLPAELEQVITVGAVNEQDEICAAADRVFAANCRWYPARGSGYGPRLDVVAPGSAAIWTTAPEQSDRSNFGGTSAATAIVSGLAALLLSANETLAPEQVEQLIKENAVPLDPHYASLPTESFGWGRIDVRATVSAAVER